MVYLASFSPILWHLVALSFFNYHLVQARDPLFTTAPRVDDRLLFARGDISTCGFISGDVKSPLTCPTSFSCVSTEQNQLGWGCCNQLQCAGNYRTCVNYGAQLCAGLNPDCSSIYTTILSCSSANPYCFSYARSLSLNAISTFFSLACGQTSTVVLALETALSGNSPATGISASSTTSGQSSPSSQGSKGGSPPSSAPSPSFSTGAKVGVAVSCIGIVVGVVVGWWKKHQVLWLITFGKRGHKKTAKSQQAHGDYPLERMGNGGANNVGVVNNILNFGPGSRH